MSEELERGARDLSQYDPMTTQELEQILRSDLDAPEGQGTDEETLLHIMEVLLERNQTDTTGSTARTAWRSFQEHYHPENDEQDDDPEETKPDKPPLRRLRRWLAAAAAVAIFISIPLCTGALHRSEPMDVVPTWTDGTFRFLPADDFEVTEPLDLPPVPSDIHAYASLQEAWEDCGGDVEVLPTWMPEGFVTEEVTVYETPRRRNYSALYVKGEATLIINIDTSSPYGSAYYEVNDSLQELYHADGTDFYIFYNLERAVAFWTKDAFECQISGDITLEELKLMIDSIEKG